MSWDEERARFPVLDRIAYLNAGTFGLLARATQDAVASSHARDGELGRGGAGYFQGMLDLRERVRIAVAEQIGAQPTQVALMSSTTDGCNAVLAGLGLGPDDEIVTTDVEHFGLVGPLAVSGARIRVARVRDRPVEEAFEAIRAEVTPRTRFLALSQVAWTTGNVLPVAALREETGIPVLVDGAQSAGAIAVDASAFDFFTVSAQKWLCGPDATGALFVREPESLGLATPSYFSVQAYDLEALTFEPKPGAARFDRGWVAVPSLAGLEAALAGLPSGRHERALEMVGRCRDRLAERVEVVTAPDQATLVSFRADGDPEELAARAYEEGVVVRDMPGTGWVRASCGWWTNDDDLDRLLAVVDRSARFRHEGQVSPESPAG